MTNANVVPDHGAADVLPSARSPAPSTTCLGKAADFYEAEVDDMVAGLSSLMEPIIIVFLGTFHWRHRGGSMYLPIFKLGSVV
jgi:type IV pilus assembly protein PilC